MNLVEIKGLGVNPQSCIKQEHSLCDEELSGMLQNPAFGKLA